MKDITAALHLNNTSWFRKYFLSTSIIDPWEKCSISDPPPPPLHPGVSWQYKNWSQVKCCKNNLPSLLSRVSDLDFSLLLSPGARCLGWPGFCGPGPLALGTHCPFPWQTPTSHRKTQANSAISAGREDPEKTWEKKLSTNCFLNWASESGRFVAGKSFREEGEISCLWL